MKSRVPSSRAARSTLDDRGATAIEYALLIALVGVVIITGVTLLGSQLSSAFTSAANGLTGATAGGGASDPCAAKTSSGSPAATCTESGGAAVWTCPTGYTVNEGASTVSCTVTPLTPYAGATPNSNYSQNLSDNGSYTIPSSATGVPNISITYGSCTGNCRDVDSFGPPTVRVDNDDWNSGSAVITYNWTVPATATVAAGSGSFTVSLT